MAASAAVAVVSVVGGLGLVAGPEHPRLGGDRRPLLLRLRGVLRWSKKGRGVRPAAK
ncbi:MAG: hypothetical protein M0C28_26660 [Candidatus Moduliflexus flocculans]|nr:hypothetical protein [Candidatus Moduliflexus flocculans]